MSGKAILLVMMGFSMLFMVAGNFFNGVSGRMTDNNIDYFNKTTSHNIAISAANLAANNLFLDKYWTTGYNNIDYQNGKYFVNVSLLYDASISLTDTFRQVTSIGIFNRDTSFVKLVLGPSKFSKFAYYSISEGGSIYWMNKDTVWGPFHTQGDLLASLKPTFYGKATFKGKIKYETSEKVDAPNFHGGFEKGVNVPMPDSGVSKLKAPSKDGGIYFDGKLPGKSTLYLEFQGDYLLYKYNSSGTYIDTFYLPTDAPNGVIFMDNGNIRMKGTVKGAYTVGCYGSTSSSTGSVYLDDDIVYQNNPVINPHSTDMLGIVAQNQVLITDNTANNHDININASIYVQENGFGAEHYNDGTVNGKINLIGGIIQKTRKAVGQFNGKTITSGFSKQYKYDERFRVVSPPFYPGTGGYEILAWYE